MNYQFDWDRILFNGLPLHFLLEVAFRSAVMFITLLIVLKLTGKRGIKQLSVFETVIIISLGSAAGDPMFYEDVGLVPAIGVFIMVLLIYRAVTWLTGKSSWFEKLVEGETECLVDEGKFSHKKFQRESLSQEEFFTELRVRNIEHLGQVRKAYLETTGEMSIYYYDTHEIKYGLPIVPELFAIKNKYIQGENIYSCARCAYTLTLSTGRHTCKICHHNEWVLSIQTKRIT